MEAALKTARILLVGMLFQLPSMSADERSFFDDGPAVLRDPAVVACFVQVLRAGAYGGRNTERAAFLVVQADRSLECRDWPATHGFREARWVGPLPEGVVAVAHTHPQSFPDPSDQDLSEARRLGIPIFVLTPKIVTVAHSDGHRETLAYHAELTRPLRDDAVAVSALHILAYR
jgi:hypothetical protein